MKAAIVTAPGKSPIYTDFPTPTAAEGEVLVAVTASALSHLSKSRSTGGHYSSSGGFPLVAGVDGVGTTPDGRRVYFVLPDAPNGALAEFCPVDERRCIPLPDSLDDVTAAALANPGMSAWAALTERAHLVAGETVLVHGATSTAGRVAVQLAKHLGAGKVIATGRNAKELEELKTLGADVIVRFDLTNGTEQFEADLQPILTAGVDVVLDYLYGPSAKVILVGLAKTAEDGHPIRFVHIGAAAGEQTLEVPGAALRAAAISLMGSGIGSVPRRKLLEAIQQVFEAAAPAGLKVATKTVPLSEIESAWGSNSGKPRLVFTTK